MPEKILIGVAWPYVNGDPHLGHIAGAYLPADIFARYHRLAGNDVLMVSGSDQHGTPTAVKAEQEGIPPAAVAERYHTRFVEAWEKLGISFDCYTHTGTENHARVVHAIFNDLLKKGYLRQETMQSPYCPRDRRFLPDRFVLGTCPRCENPDARGDQCDVCRALLDPTDLREWRCGLCGTAPELRETQHFFFLLDRFNDRLRQWIEAQSERARWRTGVRNETLGWLNEGLRPRAITRDLDWGVAIPLPGFPGKRIYVWFEAVIGYLSASLEWAADRGNPDQWRDWWCHPDTKSYYFIGKDNIPFHTMIWPAILTGINEGSDHPFGQPLVLPYDVPANHHLTVEQQKFAKRTNWAIWVPDFLSRYAADPLRYALAANLPETSDSDFSWGEFLRRNNDELVGTYGNAVHRVLNLAQVHFEGRVPEAGAPDALDRGIQEQIDLVRDQVGQALEACNFREAIRIAMSLAQSLNVYLDRKAPWKQVKSDRALAAQTIHTALQVIVNLRLIMTPFLPFSSERLGKLLNAPDLKPGDWARRGLAAGHPLGSPVPLFTKLEPEIVEQEKARMHESAPVTAQAELAPAPETLSVSTSSGDQDMDGARITYDDFSKVELRTARVTAAEKVEGADKLLKLQVDLGTESRQIVAGIAREYAPDSLVGKTIVVVANLEPRKVRGVESNGMLLAAGDESVRGLLTLDQDVAPGTRVR